MKSMVEFSTKINKDLHITTTLQVNTALIFREQCWSKTNPNWSDPMK
jgi:hypothetical protein